MALQQRQVGRQEAARVLRKIGADLRRREGGRNVYWSTRIGTWIYVDRMPTGTYMLSWNGKASDCPC
jgi:hypothetical protein